MHRRTISSDRRLTVYGGVAAAASFVVAVTTTLPKMMMISSPLCRSLVLVFVDGSKILLRLRCNECMFGCSKNTKYE